MMTKVFFNATIFLLLLASCLVAQDLPQQPIYYEHADSVVGTGGLESGVREFFGNVIFSQGNVRVRCDKAIQYLSTNRVELVGHAKVTQGTFEILAPSMTYDGNALLASAQGGVTVLDSGKTITAPRATYSTNLHIATFTGGAMVYDDSLRIASDTLVYERDRDITTALGNVYMSDTAASAIVVGDVGISDKAENTLKVFGHAKSWSFGQDTSFVEADSIIAYRANTTYEGHGNARLIRGSVRAKAETMYFNEFLGTIWLRGKPVLWSDSLQLTGDSIDVFAPNRHLRSIFARKKAMMVSRTDTVHVDRFDQVSGEYITLFVEQDTINRLLAIDDAHSITWRVEDDKPQGLATFVSDTIKVLFEQGDPVDVYWLGNVEGEHHPENVVTGRSVESYRLEGFSWVVDRPAMATVPERPKFRVKP